MRLVFVRLFTLCAALAAVAFGAAFGYAQAIVGVQPAEPRVLAGPDVGFRMEGRKGDTPVGQLVVRINGEWRVVEFASVARVVH